MRIIVISSKILSLCLYNFVVFIIAVFNTYIDYYNLWLAKDIPKISIMIHSLDYNSLSLWSIAYSINYYFWTAMIILNKCLIQAQIQILYLPFFTGNSDIWRVSSLFVPSSFPNHFQFKPSILSTSRILTTCTSSLWSLLLPTSLASASTEAFPGRSLRTWATSKTSPLRPLYVPLSRHLSSIVERKHEERCHCRSQELRVYSREIQTPKEQNQLRPDPWREVQGVSIFKFLLSPLDSLKPQKMSLCVPLWMKPCWRPSTAQKNPSSRRSSSLEEAKSTSRPSTFLNAIPSTSQRSITTLSAIPSSPLFPVITIWLYDLCPSLHCVVFKGLYRQQL